MYDDGPDDDYMTSEQACEAGWLTPDDADELRDLIRHLDIPEEPTRGLAAIVLLENLLVSDPKAATPGTEGFARYHWAKVKLSRDVLA